MSNNDKPYKGIITNWSILYERIYGLIERADRDMTTVVTSQIIDVDLKEELIYTTNSIYKVKKSLQYFYNYEVASEFYWLAYTNLYKPAYLGLKQIFETNRGSNKNDTLK